jgi:hypothetical protein
MRPGRRKKKPESYQKRLYRRLQEQHDLVTSLVQIKETDLHIQADRDVTKRAGELVLQLRLQIEEYIVKHPEFYATLTPLPLDTLAPPVVRDMMEAAQMTEVGPMAAVAGSIAEVVGMKLLHEGVREIIVENGGDIFLRRQKDSTIAIFAGQSVLSNKVGVLLPANKMPCGICTSSGTVGHSLSFGSADSVTVVADSTALADAAATRLGNEVGEAETGKDSINRALEKAGEIAGIRGVVIIRDDVLGVKGDIELVKLE